MAAPSPHHASLRSGTPTSGAECWSPIRTPPQKGVSYACMPAGTVPSAQSLIGGRGQQRRCPPVAQPNPIASATPLIGRRQRLSRRCRRRPAAVVDDHPSSRMPRVANERQHLSGASPGAAPLPARSSPRHGDEQAAFADARRGRRPSCVLGKGTTTPMTACYGCGSDFGGAAGDHVPSSQSVLQFLMARRCSRSSPPCVLRSPLFLSLSRCAILVASFLARSLSHLRSTVCRSTPRGAGCSPGTLTRRHHRDRGRLCHRASLITLKRVGGDPVWCPMEAAAYDLEWPVRDLATQLFGSDGLSNGKDNENQAHTAKSQACVSL